MKKFLLILSIVIGLYGLANAQNPIDENSTPTPGISYQIGPGTNNSLNWTYPFGAKLSVFHDTHRNFEIMNTHKGATSALAFRTFDGNSGNWTGWREMLYKDDQKRLLIPVKTYFSKSVSNYDGDFLLQSTNAGNLGNYGASISFSKLSGGVTKRAAIVAKQTSADVDNVGLSFLTHGDVGASDLVESMVINGNGNLGIGTTSPAAKTHILAENSAIQLRLERTGNPIDIGSDANGFHMWVGGYNGFGNEEFVVKQNGDIGIGTTSTDGTIHSKEVLVDVNIGTGPDYVFEADYNLISLKETKAYIEANKHLPEVPSAKIMESEGVELRDLSLLLLKKIEEMTLHQIKLMEELEALKAKIEE